MRNILVFFFLSFNAWAFDPMYSDYSKTIGTDVFNIYLDFYNFQTDSNIDGEGIKTPLPEGDSFSTSDLNFLLKFGLLKNLDIGFGLTFRINDSVESGINKTTYGEESFKLLLNWSFFNLEKFHLALDFNFNQTFYKNTEAQKDLIQLILGDPGSSLGINLLAGYSINKVLGLNGTLGWHLPPNNLSSEILYDLRLNIRFSYFLITGGFGGNFSFNNDHYDSLEEKIESHGFYTGGSNLFYSWNRQLFAPYVEVSALLWDSLRAQFNVSQNLSGRSTDTGTTLGGNLLFNFGSGTVLVKEKAKNPTGKMVVGQITRFTPENKFAKLNLGTSKYIKKGQKVFFYRKTKVEDLLLAQGVVYEVGVNWSIAKVEKYFKNENLKVGQIVKILVE